MLGNAMGCRCLLYILELSIAGHTGFCSVIYATLARAFFSARIILFCYSLFNSDIFKEVLKIIASLVSVGLYRWIT